MEEKILKQLEEAKAHFHAWRMPEAYTILRRFFDRLPFQPCAEHAQYITMFIRVLGELGKLGELKFYIAELEKIHERTRDPAIAYSLGAAYLNTELARPETARRLFEEVVRSSPNPEYQIRSKLFLCTYYDRHRSDYAACRSLLESIGKVADPALHALVEIWWGVVLREEGRFAESEQRLTALLARLEPAQEWYPYFSTRIVLANLMLRAKRFEQAMTEVEQIRQRFAGCTLKTLQFQLDALEEQVRKAMRIRPVQYRIDGESTTLIYENRALNLKIDSSAATLLELLVRKRFLEKGLIVKGIYRREYDSDRDDKLVYYHIHSLRKRLEAIGLPPDAIRSEGDGYRFVPEVETVQGDDAWA